MRGAFFILLFLIPLVSFAANYSNDSNSININYTGPVPTQGGGGANDAGITGNGGSAGAGGSGGASGSASGTSNGNANDNVTISFSVNGNGLQGNGTGVGNGTSGNTQGGTASGSHTGNENTDPGKEVLNTLFGNQALSFGASRGEGDMGDVGLSGDKARSALKARGISAISIVVDLKNKFLSRGDFAIAAASSVLQNPALTNVLLSLDTLSISYRAEGRLFAVFPIEYPVTLLVNANGTTPAERVSVQFPWYSFFLQKFVGRVELQNSISASIDRLLAELAADSEDPKSINAKARLLLAVTGVINARFDTVTDSVH